MDHISHLESDFQKLIKNFNPPQQIMPMTGDKWIAASALQNAIRRGNVPLAFVACDRLLGLDKRMLYRRLAITLLEDIGLADPHLVKLVLVGLLEIRAIKQMGLNPNHLLFPLLQALCEAPKERSGDYLIMMCEDHNSLVHDRDDFCYYSNSDLTDVISNETYSLHRRALATWYLAGTRIYRSDKLTLTGGDQEALFWIFEEMGAEKCLLDIIQGAAKKINNPLPVHYLLKYLELGKENISPLESPKLPDTHSYNSIPLYALGGHTRLGKAAIRQVIKENGPLTDFLSRVADHRYHRAIYASALFNVESALVEREVTFAGYDTMKAEATTAILTAKGVNASDIPDLLQVTRDSLEDLNNIRRKLLKTAEGKAAPNQVGL